MFSGGEIEGDRAGFRGDSIRPGIVGQLPQTEVIGEGAFELPAQAVLIAAEDIERLRAVGERFEGLGQADGFIEELVSAVE
jgi:hypothetical protein